MSISESIADAGVGYTLLMRQVKRASERLGQLTSRRHVHVLARISTLHHLYKLRTQCCSARRADHLITWNFPKCRQSRGYYAFYRTIYAPTLCMHTMILLFFTKLSIFRKGGVQTRRESNHKHIHSTFITTSIISNERYVCKRNLNVIICLF
jgi:hypothetical protein